MSLSLPCAIFLNETNNFFLRSDHTAKSKLPIGPTWPMQPWPMQPKCYLSSLLFFFIHPFKSFSSHNFTPDSGSKIACRWPCAGLKQFVLLVQLFHRELFEKIPLDDFGIRLSSDHTNTSSWKFGRRHHCCRQHGNHVKLRSYSARNRT